MITQEFVDNLTPEDSSLALIEKLNTFGWEERGSNSKLAYRAAVKSEQLAIILQNQIGICSSLKIQGYCLWRFSDYPASMEASSKALKIAETLEDLKSQADILNNIGAVYMFLKENKKRLQTNLQCLEIRKQIGDHEGVSGSLNNIGETYMEMGDLESAKKYFHQCLAYPYSNLDSKAWVYHNLGLLEKRKERHKDAIIQLYKSSELMDVSDYKILNCNSFYHIASSHFRLGEYEDCKVTLQKSFDLASALGAKEELQNIHLAFSELHEVLGDIERAYNHFKLYSQFKSEIYNEQNDARMINLKSQHEIEVAKRSAEIEREKHIEIQAAFNQIEIQKKLVEEKNRAINDSIEYAKRIQKAIILNESDILDAGLQFYSIFSPKDVVSGDFFWHKIVDDHIYIAVVDCTGHGVPGAFLSILGVAFLNEICSQPEILKTGEVLDVLRDKIITLLGHEGQSQSLEGMDMSLIRLDRSNMKMQYSGPLNKSFLVRNNEVVVLLPDDMTIGATENKQNFKTNEIGLEIGDVIFQCSDGCIDQFGGPKNKKIGKHNLKLWLKEASKLKMKDQELFLNEKFSTWKGENTQIDDMTLFAVKP